MWTEFRYAILRALRELNAIPEGAKAPYWMMVVYHTLFPFNWLYERQSNIKYEVLYDTYIVRGIRITGHCYDMFRGEIGNRFEIVASKDGIVTVRKLDEITLPIHEN